MIEGHAYTVYKVNLKSVRRQLGTTERHFLNEFGEGENEQITNSTEGILMFQNMRQYMSFLYASALPALAYPLLLTAL